MQQGAGGQVVVNAVPNRGFMPPQLTTEAGSIVKRARLYVPSNSPAGVVGNVTNQGGVLNKVIFDLVDPRNFIDLTKLTLVGGFMGSFRAHAENVQTYNADKNKDIWYDVGAGPSLDQNSSALIATLRVMTQQNTVIEEIPAYGLLTNIMDAHTESISHKEFSLLDYSCGHFERFQPFYKGKLCELGDDPMLAYDSSSRLADNLGMLTMPSLFMTNAKAVIQSGTPITYNQLKSFNLCFYASAFLQRVKFFPLRNMNNALRIEIVFQSAFKAFKCDHLGVPPQFGTYLVPDSQRGSWNDVGTRTSDDKSGRKGAMLGDAIINATETAAWWRIGHKRSAPQGSPVLTDAVPYADSYWNVPHSGSVTTPTLPANFYGNVSFSPVEWNQSNSNATSVRAPLYALQFRAGEVTFTSAIPVVAATPNTTYVQNTTEVITTQRALPPQSGFIALPGHYWMLCYNGSPVTILRVEAVIPNPADNAFDLVILADQGVSENEDVAMLQQAYGLLPLAYYADSLNMGYGTLPSDGNWADLYMDNTQTQNSALAAAAYKGIKSADLIKFNFNSIYTLPPSANPLNQVWDANGDLVRPRTAPNIAMTPLPLPDGTHRNQQTLTQGFISQELGVFSQNNISQRPAWNYVLYDLKLLVDLVMPSDNIRADYQQMFESPNGIPYPYTRYFVQQHQLGNSGGTLQGMQQLVLPFKMRSLRTLYIILSDPLLDGSSGDFTMYNFPSLSSFRMAGLYEAYVQVGGETYPAHRFRFDTSMIQNSHIPELLSCLDVNMSSLWSPQYHISRLHRQSRNYLCYGYYGSNDGSGFTRGIQDPPQGGAGATSILTTSWNGLTISDANANARDLTIMRRWRYKDTSRFILAVNMARVDKNFMAGVDCSQGTGAVVLFMNFAATTNRPLVCYTIADCDCVFSLQAAQPLVRI